ncbi:RNA-binding protein, putative [Plasmodium ovale curtisi]|uniref:RNA-binding protein, putative n=2 Tax=Plasmodium ovale TaxID=36330 RepID=A0A1A8WAH5_PLAOA|nr:RNA-binding protein, putative [Plasmodium ovale curtisi]SBS98656.1 RNA-binding protein, putative [Plasmodium ovale curtisi]
MWLYAAERMNRYGHNVRADVKKQGYENSDLPILCETCLGENPYVRIMREENGKECKICKNAFTLFRWKPGQNARYKQTVICNKCAKVKNVCQTCLFDLEFNLPVRVRDKFISSSITLPENETNRNFFLEQLEKNITTNTYDKINSVRMDLVKMKRYDPYFKRNMARVCSFWRKNACNRGDECPYLHKEIHLDKSLANQNIKSRYTGENDILAEKILKKYDEKNIDEKRMINQICIQGLNEAVSQENIKNSFNKFGEIKSIKMIPKDSKMFISYATSLSAKKAAEKYKDGLELNGCNLTVTLQDEVFHRNTFPLTSPVYNTKKMSIHGGINFLQVPPNPPPPPQVGGIIPTIHRSGSAGNRGSAQRMFFPPYSGSFNPKAPGAVPYSSMLPSEAEQRK